MRGRIRRYFLDSALAKKIIAGYLFIVLIPTILAAGIVYQRMKTSLLHDYIGQRQQLLEDHKEALEAELRNIAEVSRLFQSNAEVIEYLEGYYAASDADSVYTTLKYILPVWNYLASAFPQIADVTIYKERQEVKRVSSLIVEGDLLDDQLRSDVLNGSFGRELWRVSQEEGEIDLRCYTRIYNSAYSSVIAILETKAGDTVLEDYVHSLENMSEQETVLLCHEDQILYCSPKDPAERLSAFYQERSREGTLPSDEGFEASLGGETYIINYAPSALTGIGALLVRPAGTAIRSGFFGGRILVLLALFFLLFSAVYYLITYSVTRRITRLSRHIEKADRTHLTPYEGEQGLDEIGTLIRSYNGMISEIDELVNRAHREELLRKEADYRALQAQIHPHFLYGTLESIRMMAELNDDEEVANIIYTFGKYLRYSLSAMDSVVTVGRELENVRNYLEVQRLRFGERLHVRIHAEPETEEIVCPFFILQPLVENAIRHGLSQIQGEARIEITSEMKETAVVIRVSDNGKGIAPDRLEQIQRLLSGETALDQVQTDRSGFGLYNVNERVRLFYGQDAYLTLENGEDEGTVSILSFRIKQ